MHLPNSRASLALLILLLASRSQAGPSVLRAQAADADASHRLFLPYAAQPAPVELELLGRSGHGVALAAEAGLAYLAAEGRLRVIDPRDADAPRIVGEASLAGTTTWMKAHQGWLYLREEERPDRVAIWDLRDPARPRAAGGFEPERPARDLAFAEDRAYACEADGITIHRLDPATGQATPIGRIDLPDQTEAIDAAACHGLDGGFVAIGDGRPAPELGGILYGPGLRLFDARDPERGVELAGIRSPGWTRGLPIGFAARGDLIVEIWHSIPMSGGFDSLMFHELDRDTGALRLRGGVSLQNQIRATVDRLLVAEDRILALGWGWLAVIDIEDRDAPRLAARIDLEGLPIAAALTEDRLLGLGRELRVTRIEDLDAPELAGGLRLFTGQALALEADPSSGRLAVAQKDQGLPTLLDSAGAARPYDARPAPGLEPSRRYAFAFGPSGLMAWANDRELLLIDPAAAGPPRARIPHAAGSPVRLVIADDRAYISGYAGLAIVGIEGDRLSLLGTLPDDRRTYRRGDLAVEGGIALLGRQVSGFELQVIDVRDPSAPVELSRLPLEGPWLEGLALRGGIGYASVEGGLRVVDLRDPSAPVVLGFVEGLGWPTDVLVSGRWAFVSDLLGNLHALDLADPVRPGLERTLTIPGRPRQLAALPGRLYVAAESGGLATVGVWSFSDLGPELGAPPIRRP